MTREQDENVHAAVRERYKSAVTASQSCCGGAQTPEPCCCSAEVSSTHFGYTAEELDSLPDGADLSLGCGNPTALAGITPGETVVDLGSGAGIDCFLAARRTGTNGCVIGVDMTAEMVAAARANAVRGGFSNVEFRLGEIEHLPVADASADLIISNCVINLSPDKHRVFAEAFRVLKTGGRLIVSDPVLVRALPDELRENTALLTGCIAGAMIREEYVAAIRQAGFEEVRIEKDLPYAKPEHLASLAAQADIDAATTELIASVVRSVTIFARK